MFDLRAEKLRHGDTTWVAIHDILLHEWDPIGVSTESDAQDEYDSYIAGVRELLERDASEDDVVHHLDGIATKRMGFTSAPAACRRAAVSLVSLPHVATVQVPLGDWEAALQHARAGHTVLLVGDGEAFRLWRLRRESPPEESDTRQSPE